MGKLLSIFGGFGVGIGILCCVSTLLPFILTAIGAEALIATLYRDAVLFPFVGISLVILGIGLRMMRKARSTAVND